MDEFNPVTQEASDAFVQGMLGQEQEQQTEQMEQDLGVTPEAPASPAPVEPAPQQAPEQAAPAPQEAPQEREAGQDGSERNIVGMVQEAASNLVGMLPEEWTRDRSQDEGVKTDAEEGSFMEGVVDYVTEGQGTIEPGTGGNEGARAVIGGTLDAAEDVMGAAEVVGDTVKTFATLGNVASDQNPFSSDYDWAQWKLGADEFGSTTQVGQFAQELVSFASIGSKLGAFKSINAPLTSTTRLGTAGQVASRAGIEALYGFAADAVKGLAGEGNFANMIEQIIPGLKDTWIMALAVDEDDNPWEAAVKSGLDGMALGFPVGALGNIAAAVRHAKNLPEGERVAAVATKFAELSEQQELKLGNVQAKPEKTLAAHDVFTEAADGDLSRLNQLNAEELRSLMTNYEMTQFASPRDILQNVDPFVSYEAIGEAIFNKKLPNGSNIEWMLKDISEQFEPVGVREQDLARAQQIMNEGGIENTPENLQQILSDMGVGQSSTHPLSGRKVNRIDWDIMDSDAAAGGLGRDAPKMFKQFSEVVSDTLKPGDIMMTEAAEDGFGAAGKSAAQERGALNKNSNRNKAAKKWVSDNEATLQKQYLEDIGETDPEFWAALDTQAKWDHFDGRQVEGVEPFKVPDSEKSVRQSLYERAGFSSPDEMEGRMYGIVRKDKKGRARLEPMDINGDIDAQVLKAQEDSASQMELPGLEVIEDRLKAGVPVYWDDVADTVPEMFTPGSRAVQPDFSPSVYEQLRTMGPDDGLSINPFDASVPEKGTMVAIDGKSLDSLEPNDVQDFIADNYDILSREDVYLGAWVSEITGKPVVELSRLVDNFDEAKALGEAFDQEGIFRMDDFSYHSTGGIDRLKETKGFHQRSAYTQPNYVREPGDAQSIARMQFTPEAPNGAIGGRLYTDSQIGKVAEAEGDAVAKSLDQLVEQIDVRAEDMADMMPVKDVYEKVSYDLDDFIDDGGHVDVSKLTKGVDGLLDQQGSLQTRILISNIAGTVFDEARVAASKTRQGIDDTASLEIMTDNLKVLLRLHKKVANTRSRQLAQFAMPLNKAEGAKVRKLQADADAADKGMEIAEKALNDMVAGIKSGDPKRVRQAKRTAAFMELTGGNPAKMARVAKGIPDLYMDVALKHMYNSLLSSPATHVVNTASNFLQMTSRPIQAALGGQGAAAKASFYNIGEMLSESFNLAGRTFADGSTQGSKMIQTSEVDLALKNLAETADTPIKKLHSGVLNMLNDMANNPLLGWPSKFLTTSDEFFKAMNARMEYRVQTYLEAEELAKVSPGKETDTIMRELMSNKSRKSRNFGKKDGRVMDEKLLDVAKELTFQTDLEGWAGSFANTIHEIPVLRPFFPFVKTGHNIMVYTGTHTPVLNLALSESRKALRGELGPYAQAVHRGRLAMGGMFMMVGGLAAHNGVITGSGPKDKNRRSEWMKTHQPRSLKVGDTWISYDRIEPFGQILTAVADIHHAMQEGELEPNKAEYLAQYLMYSISSNITDKTFFQGVNDLANIISPNGAGAGTKAIDAVVNLVNNFMPKAGLRRAYSNALTPYMQEYHRLYDRTLNQMGLGDFIEAPADKVDHLTGEKLDSASAGFWNALLPLKTVERGSDSVRDALEDIHFETAAVRQEIGFIDLKPKEESRLNELIAETGLHARLKKLTSNPQWIKAVEDHREAMIAGTSNMDRTGMKYYTDIKDLYTQHMGYALELLKRENPELAGAIYHNQVTKKKASMGHIEGIIQSRY